jgi:glycosyltransferase involved in cell wall biosynthesis
MISVVIATHDSEALLVPTLSALVPAAVAGVVREVIVADGGSTDATATVADVAGCRFLAAPGPLGARLTAAAATARAQWLLFLQPGSVPDAAWTEEAGRFVREAELAGSADMRAAVFRPRPGHARSTLAEAFVLFASALGARPKPSQGLLILKGLYNRIGRHDAASPDPEAALLRSLGRRRIVQLGCWATTVAIRP